jgi:hypothetical protein
MIAIFLFYKFANGKQAWLGLSKEFKHCNVITYDGEHWINFDMDRQGIHSKVLDVPNGNALLRGLKIIKLLTAMICVNVGERKKINWKPLWVKSCNELDRYLTGVDIGFTFNPMHLHRKLIKYSGRRNYEILYAWRRKDGDIWRRRRRSTRKCRLDEPANQAEPS